MSKVVVIADDLTGANATGVLLTKHGYKVATFLNLKKYNINDHGEFNIVSISTDTRAVEKDKAYESVKKVVNHFKYDDVALFSKRIDSTLRGNIGVEICAVLNNLENDICAVVVPSFPDSGRVCVGGFILVNQVPLEKTEAAFDPKTPVFTSKVIDVLKTQISEKIGYISLEDVLKGSETIKDELRKQADNHCRVIIVDAATNDDIAKIAEAVKMSELKVISVDPGPFTAALTKEYLNVIQEQTKYNVMLTIGSMSNLTKKQIIEFNALYSPLVADVNAENLIFDETRDKEINKAVAMLVNGALSHKIIAATTSCSNKIVNFKQTAMKLGITEEEISKRITEGLAQITVNVLRKTESI